MAPQRLGFWILEVTFFSGNGVGPMDIYVARQPIFDLQRQVVAYELLFRSGPENFFSHPDADDAARRVIENAFHTFGLPALAGNKRLYFNCTRKLLLENFMALLPPKLAVVEVLENVRPDAAILSALSQLKAAGYTLALDDFVTQPGQDALVALADIIKVDFLVTQGAQRGALVKRWSRPGLQFLAEKVETQADADEAQALGYSLLQGYFYARPQMLLAKDIPASKLAKLRLMRELLSEPVNLDRLEQVIKSDVALSVKLLRYLNSAAFGWRSEVSSIRRAMVLLGMQPFRQWASLVALTMVGSDHPTELLLTCLIRARFCELLGTQLHLKEHTFELFLVGLLSLLDVLLGRPLPELLDLLAVSPHVRHTLTAQGDTPLAPVFAAALAYERGAWDQEALRAPGLGAAAVDLPRVYTAAVAWAQQLFQGE